jgi:1,2-dihydroxy-3-keto-5-methylthiopentene dioxygenase
MASIRIRNTGERIEGEANVRAFLEEQGVLYEHWDTEKLPEKLRDKFVLTDEEKEEILRAYDEDIRSLAERNGYVKWDVVALSPETPNLDELLKKFEQVHVHTED